MLLPNELKVLSRFELEVGEALDQVVKKANTPGRFLSPNQLFRLFCNEVRTNCRRRKRPINRYPLPLSLPEVDLSAFPEDVQQLLRDPPNGDFCAALNLVTQHPCWTSP